MNSRDATDFPNLYRKFRFDGVRGENYTSVICSYK